MSEHCKFCDRPIKGLGMCEAHYCRYKRGARGERLSGPVGGIGGRQPVNIETPDQIEEHGIRSENKNLRKQVNQLLDRHVSDSRYESFIGEVCARKSDPPEWIRQEPKRGKYEVMPTVSFSDWHFDEVVDPKQIQGSNGYNREIAEKRLQNYFRNISDICHRFLAGFEYPGIIMPWLGDNFSGNIHEELKQTNADVMMSSLLYWVGPMVTGLKSLADAFGRVYVPVVVGNHSRNTMKPVNKMRVRDNFDWLWAQIVARELSGDKRISFHISESADYTYRCFNTVYHITHGDQARGGTGIAAQWSPLMLMAVRKLKRVRFDYLVCGHWHRLGQFLKIRANGSGIGYGEYAFHCNFDWEPPQQDLWLTDPHHGIICDFPVHVMSRDEPWNKRSPEKGIPFRG